MHISIIYLSLPYIQIIVSLTRASAEKGEVCNQDLLDRSFVTQCGPSFCEPVLDEEYKKVNEWPTSKDEVIHIVSSRAGDRFKVNTYKAMDTTEFYYEESHPNGTIFVDTKVKYQKILGFGSTFTDASCANINDLPDNIRKKLIEDYFSTENGIGLNLIKIPIGSSKYSYTNYVLDQPDKHQIELSPYDTDLRIPIIKDAIEAAGKVKSRVKIIASSATAPPELKDNNRMVRGGSLKQNKFDEYASYLNGFVAAYKAHNLKVWSLILSESPVTISSIRDANSTLDYNSMAMKPSETVKLIDSMSKIRATQPEAEKFRLLILGDDRANIPVWADSVFESKNALNNVAGVAYTCNNERFDPYDNLMYVTRRYPNKYLLASQSSINSPVKLGNWQYAENYGGEVVKNLEFGSVGWIDFNLALNLEGGPSISDKFKGKFQLVHFPLIPFKITNLSPNYSADASIMVDPKRGFYYRNPMFYAVGHLSRYVRPGSIRVKIDFYSSPHMYAAQHIAFITPDNYLVTFIMNNNIGPMPVNIGVDTRTKVETLLDTKSFNTFIFRL